MRSLLALVVFAGGCVAVTDAPPPTLELPPLDGDAADLSQWWTRFEDPRLQALIEQALTDNRDLLAAAARVDEAAALVRTSDLLPEIDLRAGIGRSQTSDVNAFPRFPGIDRRNYANSVALDLTYEVDLWGRVRAANRAVLADLQANEAALDALRSSLAARTAQAYFRLVALDRRLALTRDTLANRESALRILRQRQQAGTSPALEVHQAEAELAAVAAILPPLESAQAAAARALCVLTGASPAVIAAPDIARDGELPAPPAIPEGLPSDLLERRPDVREAQARLAGSGARVTEARARYFPTIRLTGTLGQESKDLSDLFTAPATVWNLAASLAQPLLGLRKVDARVAAAQARQRQAEAEYVRSVQNAFTETYDALDALTSTRATLAAQDRQVDALRAAERIASVRHDAGAGSYYELLDARRQLLAVETARLDTRAQRLLTTIDVFRALGGGWPIDQAPRQ